MKSRNYGIDFLRIISMFMVVILHILGQGGILKASEFMSANYIAGWLFEIASYCAVNIFALISGYVMCHSKPRISKLSELWLQVAFYSVSLAVLFMYLKPETYNSATLLNAFFPVTKKQYWYISAYFGMYLLTPLLNAVIINVSKKTFTLSLFSCFFVLSVLPTVLKNDAYGFKGGYAEHTTTKMVLFLFASAMIIYCLCTLIELLRIVLFKLFRIKALCMKLDTALTNLFGKLYEKLFL